MSLRSGPFHASVPPQSIGTILGRVELSVQPFELPRRASFRQSAVSPFELLPSACSSPTPPGRPSNLCFDGGGGTTAESAGPLLGRVLASFGSGLRGRGRLSLSATGSFALAAGGWMGSAAAAAVVGGETALEPFFCQCGPVLSRIAFLEFG